MSHKLAVYLKVKHMAGKHSQASHDPHKGGSSGSSKYVETDAAKIGRETGNYSKHLSAVRERFGGEYADEAASWIGNISQGLPVKLHPVAKDYAVWASGNGYKTLQSSKTLNKFYRDAGKDANEITELGRILFRDPNYFARD